ncbi:MAG: hypothetical protein AVDCRST_MAG39-850 [uncultured Sphingomonadaceae bacterium]|uniref:Uncharacterized protein n=1 Tax=uncultured Sphingomonadaceae bacterium TaxID=169976 RepID=A0A6J4S8I0_9SPHN|nr:MAG: hypothetical protein AVDCRST_MAG39-850 [uncultured Sphingomonadaceae bacterium]
MRLLIVAGAVLIAAPGPARAEAYFTWAPGQSREIEPGLRVTLERVMSGWRLWRYETADGSDCRAVRPAAGKLFPIPLDADSFLRGAPALEIRFRQGEPARWALHVADPGTRAFVRRSTGRWVEQAGWSALDSLPSRELVVVEDWPEPDEVGQRIRGSERIVLGRMPKLLAAGKSCVARTVGRS